MKYCDSALRDPMKDRFPFTASCYSKIKKNNNGYIKCAFTFEYIDKKGLDFSMVQVMNCNNNHEVIEQWKRSISRVIDLPCKEKANQAVSIMDKGKQRKLVRSI
jgi:hypothetical protein